MERRFRTPVTSAMDAPIQSLSSCPEYQRQATVYRITILRPAHEYLKSGNDKRDRHYFLKSCFFLPKSRESQYHRCQSPFQQEFDLPYFSNGPQSRPTVPRLDGAWQRDRKGNRTNKFLDRLGCRYAPPVMPGTTLGISGGKEKGRLGYRRAALIGVEKGQRQALRDLILFASREIFRDTVLRCRIPLLTPRIISGWASRNAV